MSEAIQIEIEQIKTELDSLGVKYHPSTGIDKLREKLASATEEAPTGETTVSEAKQEAPKPVARKDDPLALKRVIVSCNDPVKLSWESELFSVGNREIGTIKHCVPFDREWHIPQIIINILKERTCQIHVTKRDSRGNRTKQGKLIRAYTVNELPMLSTTELKELGQRQLMAAGKSEAL